METKTIQDLIDFLSRQPDEVKKSEIWYIDISFPNGDFEITVDKSFGAAMSN
jgi:hypothetical protein